MTAPLGYCSFAAPPADPDTELGNVFHTTQSGSVYDAKPATSYPPLALITSTSKNGTATLDSISAAIKSSEIKATTFSYQSRQSIIRLVEQCHDRIKSREETQKTENSMDWTTSPITKIVKTKA